MYIIDVENRKIIITDEITKNVMEIKENEKLDRIFHEGTQDKYECVLKLIDVDVINPETQEKTGEKVTKAFAQRVNNPSWIMEFFEKEYNL